MAGSGAAHVILTAMRMPTEFMMHRMLRAGVDGWCLQPIMRGKARYLLWLHWKFVQVAAIGVVQDVTRGRALQALHGCWLQCFIEPCVSARQSITSRLLRYACSDFTNCFVWVKMLNH